jgi:DNA polymerase-3 subunit alpha (Gram-positive type)
MNYMLELGIDRENAYKIMDTVRKRRPLRTEQIELMRDHGVPEWYIESCGKVVYLFPRAHAVVYTMMAFRLAWYKVHFPEAYAKLPISKDCDNSRERYR